MPDDGNLYMMSSKRRMSMNGRKPSRSGSESVQSRVRDRLGSVDRGWKATLVGLVVAFLYAVGVV